MTGRALKFYKRSMRKAPLKNKTVLLRVDYNVPFEDSKIADDFRIRASLDTVQRLLRDHCKVVIISHLGRPEGEKRVEFSLEPVAQRLAELLDEPVRFVDDCIGQKVKMAVKRAPGRSVVVLENLRFHPEEESNDRDFAAKMARDSGAQYFVQDGFGVVHRAHASTEAITHFLPSVAGLLLEREWLAIESAIAHPSRPLLAILGGAKVSDKIQVINRLVSVADQIVMGGAMANTFLAENGTQLGKSKYEDGQGEIIRDIYDKVRRKVSEKYQNNFLILPSDLAVGSSVEDGDRRNVALDKVGAEDIALDIGEESIERLEHAIEKASTIIWNGTLGMAENPAFALGSERAARALAGQPSKISVIGGGDTADFVLHWDENRGKSFTHVSTGGGASLDLMSGKELPGIEALLDA